MLDRHLVAHWFLPLIVVAVLFEIGWYLFMRKRSYPWTEMLVSATIFVLRIPFRFLRAVLVIPLIYFVWSHRIATVPLDTVWGSALVVLGEEFAYYWMHRASHEVRWLWASHVVHHTPEQIHLASAFRLGGTEIFSGGWLFHMPLYFLGLNPAAVGLVLAINLFYQFWLHTDMVGRLGPLEWLFNTPAHHRVHHASNPEYLDRNYGGILIVFDRLFGTLALERPSTNIVYGLAHPIGTMNPIRIMFNEWLSMARDVWRARTWRERISQMFGRPGDSSTAVALQPLQTTS